MEIIGHNTIVSLMEKAIEEDRFGHAYCFVGVDHIGKETVARHIASCLLRVKSNALINSSDFLLVNRLKDEKTGKTKKDISIDQIKEVAQFMARSSFGAGGHKVVIISEADAMSMGAANALLKTLEEPSARSHIFLLTHDDAKILPTIKSRCHTIRFTPVPQEVIKNHLMERGGREDKAETIACVSRGLPGLAILWYDNNDAFVTHTEAVTRFLDLFGKTFHEKLQATDTMFGDKSDAIATREDIKDILDTWRLAARNIFFSSHGLEKHQMSHTIKISRETFLAIDECIVRASRMIDKNIHPRLLIEQILLQIP